jgi:hypothetical protein
MAPLCMTKFKLGLKVYYLRVGVGYVYLCRLYQSNRWAKGVPCPKNKGVSYTNLVFRLAIILKFDYYYIILIQVIERKIHFLLFCLNLSFTRYLCTLFYKINEYLYILLHRRCYIRGGSSGGFRRLSKPYKNLQSVYQQSTNLLSPHVFSFTNSHCYCSRRLLHASSSHTSSSS